MVRIQDVHCKIFYFVVCLRNIEGNETNIKRKRRSEKALNFQAYFPTFPKGWLRSVTGSAKPWLLEGHLARKGGCYNSRGMQKSQGILVVHVGPLLQESIDVGQASPLPAGGAGKHQGERAHLRVAIISLLPQALLVSISEPVQGLLLHDAFKHVLVFLSEAAKLIAGAELVSRGTGELDVEGRGGKVNLQDDTVRLVEIRYTPTGTGIFLCCWP